MGDQPITLTPEEVQTLALKISQLRSELGPREQVALDYLMAQARTNIAEVAGYDEGTQGIGQGVHEGYGFLRGLTNVPLGTAAPPGFNLDEHRFGGGAFNR